jgi:hypothetical protein
VLLALLSPVLGDRMRAVAYYLPPGGRHKRLDRSFV